MITSKHKSSQCFNVSSITSEKVSTSWDSSLFTVSGLQEEHHNVTSFLDGRRAATETLGVGEPGRRVMQLPPSYSKAGSRIYLVRDFEQRGHQEYWQRSQLMDNWAHLRGFADQLVPCLTNVMALLHELTFQVSKNRWKEQSGATFTSRPQILFLSVCNVFCSQG